MQGPLQSSSIPIPGASYSWDNTVWNPVSYILTASWEMFRLDSLGQGNVSLVIHSEADAWGSATGERRKGTQWRVENDSLGVWGTFVSNYLTTARQIGDEGNGSGSSAQNPAA